MGATGFTKGEDDPCHSESEDADERKCQVTKLLCYQAAGSSVAFIEEKGSVFVFFSKKVVFLNEFLSLHHFVAFGQLLPK